MTKTMAISLEFEAFDKENPEVYSLFHKYALNLIRAGISRYSADAILHVIRFQKVMSTAGAAPYKINNNYTSRYARKFINENPKYAGFFETRTLR